MDIQQVLNDLSKTVKTYSQALKQSLNKSIENLVNVSEKINAVTHAYSSKSESLLQKNLYIHIFQSDCSLQKSRYKFLQEFRLQKFSI